MHIIRDLTGSHFCEEFYKDHYSFDTKLNIYKELALKEGFTFEIKFNHLNQFEVTILKDSIKYWSMNETASGALLGAYLNASN